MNETERVRAIQDKGAPRYDRQIGFFERVLFADGRQWATAHASGEVLELAIGTARNLPYQAVKYYRLDPPGIARPELLTAIKSHLASQLPAVGGARDRRRGRRGVRRCAFDRHRPQLGGCGRWQRRRRRAL
jgi:hypothetical protein